ncbi:MAG: Intracellular proteinase inhibitor [Candidatus Sumerlaeota bacterium]|nr:Intracellular proteinase inhibitor [Candidatus Sumerlaeota bacterium]
MTRLRLLPLLLIPVLIAACAGKPKATAEALSGDGMVLRVEASPTRVEKAGAAVNVRLLATNAHKGPIKLLFNSSKKFDLLLADSEGTVLWQYGGDRYYTMALEEVYLQPGESIEERIQLTLPPRGVKLAPGTYQLTGILEGNAKMTGEPVEIEYAPAP